MYSYTYVYTYNIVGRYTCNYERFRHDILYVQDYNANTRRYTRATFFTDNNSREKNEFGLRTRIYLGQSYIRVISCMCAQSRRVIL